MAHPTPLDYAKTLRAAARALEQHHARVRDTELEPGLGAQLQLGPLLRSTFSLAETLMDELTAMSTSTAFTSTTGSRQSLNTLASALASVTDAAAELGFAIGENAHPGKAQGDIPDPADGTVWKALCDQARPCMEEHLHNAAHQLELASSPATTSPGPSNSATPRHSAGPARHLPLRLPRRPPHPLPAPHA
ncbi:hypothetical protein ACFVJ8_01915 [Streptomyces yangpuensis]|uniref:hypothetical protein n=1 Tax=Streptomyces yangpuensis TaxID=1648182 RepID=UPI00363DE47A